MTQDRATPNGDGQKVPYQKAVSFNHYTLLGLHPSASVQEIRQTYREMSKLYHPDTTQLPSVTATQKFQQINEAYATLCNPERRSAYDLKIGYSRVIVVQPLPSLNRPQPHYTNSAYLDATDRPLSAGEIFALFILGITFVGCLVLAITIGFTRGEAAFQPVTAQGAIVQDTSQPVMEKVISPKTPEIPTSEIPMSFDSSSDSVD